MSDETVTELEERRESDRAPRLFYSSRDDCHGQQQETADS